MEQRDVVDSCERCGAFTSWLKACEMTRSREFPLFLI